MYFFPRRKVGLKESAGTIRDTTTKATIQKTGVDEVKALVDQVSWKIEASEKEPTYVHSTCSWFVRGHVSVTTLNCGHMST